MALLQFYLVIIVALEGSCGKNTNTYGDHRTADEGENVVMHCGSDPAEVVSHVYWYKYETNKTLLLSKLPAGDQITFSSREYQIQNGTDLFIPNATEGDSGTYQCSVFSYLRLDEQQYNTSLLVGVSACILRSYRGSIHGNLTSNCSSNDKVPYNTKCIFECEDSSILVGRSLLTCGANGTFDYPLPKCHDGQLYLVSESWENMYSHVNYRTADVGEDVVMPCGGAPAEDVYTVYWYKYETNQTDLLLKTSTGELPTYSDRGYQVKNGTDLLIPNATLDDSGTYYCDVFSYERFDRQLYISSLSVGVSTCTLRSYHEPNHGNLTSNCTSNQKVPYNTKCSFECDDSSILVGRPLLTCGANDTFDYPSPTCRVSNCTLRSYHESDFGYLTSNCSSNGTVRYHTKCRFKCDDSSFLRGRSLLTCEANDTFDYPLPKCHDFYHYFLSRSWKNTYVDHRIADVGEDVLMPCGGAEVQVASNVYWFKCGTNKTVLLLKSSNGVQTTYSDRGYQIRNDIELLLPSATKGDSGTYQCFVFSLGRYHQSLHSSSWSVRGTCKMPTLTGALHTNTTTCRSEATIVEGTTCHYYCQSHSSLVGEPTTICLENGSLSEDVPFCTPKGGQTRRKWWISLFIVPLVLIIGGVFLILKNCKGKTRNYSAGVLPKYTAMLPCRTTNAPQQ